MSIPDPPYPAVIDKTDILPGMHIRFTATFPHVDGTYQAEGVVLAVNSSALTSAISSDGSVIITLPLEQGAFGFDDETFELMESFTGDVTEPTANTVVQAVDGTVYQRQPDPADPTNSVWVATNSTTTTTWTDITSGGTPTVLLDGSTL